MLSALVLMCVFTRIRVLPQLVGAALREVSYQGYLWTPFCPEVFFGGGRFASGVIHWAAHESSARHCGGGSAANALLKARASLLLKAPAGMLF